jgi:hypothetical protein
VRSIFPMKTFHIFKKDSVQSLLRVTWFDDWHSDLDDALNELPEQRDCPSQLFRMLHENPTGERKRTALITEHGTPVALLSLRDRGQSWVPVTHFLLPGDVFPTKPGYLIRSLETLGLNIWVAWWRVEGKPPHSRFTRSLESTPTFKMSLSEDFEAYWQSKKHLKTVRTMRKRCRDFDIAINAPGATDWTIRNYEKKWGLANYDEQTCISDRLLVAKYLEQKDRIVTFIIKDSQKPICGSTLFEHNNELVGVYSYRESEYDWHGVGHYVLDHIFHWAAEQGYKKFDMGGDYPHHKKRWAPQDGQKFTFNICPGYKYYAKQILDKMARVRTNIVYLSGLQKLWTRPVKEDATKPVK